MQWEFVVALMVAVPVILFPAAFIWYLNIGGAIHAAKEAKEARQKKLETAEAKAQ